MRKIICFALALMLCSCSVHRNIPTQVVAQHDTTYRIVDRVDSVFIRDSIFIMEKGDTVVQYREHWNYRDRIVRDTLWKHRTDTLWQEKQVLVETPIKWYDRASIYAGRILLAALLLIIAWEAFRRKLKL